MLARQMQAPSRRGPTVVIFGLMQLSPEWIQRALTLRNFDYTEANKVFVAMNRRARTRPAAMPGEPRVASVLILLYTVASEWHLVLTKRRGNLNAHAGQISFPGGRKEPHESLAEAALREAEEEVAIVPKKVDLMGRMESIYIPPSDFQVHPFVGLYRDRPIFDAATDEVEEVIETPLALLNDPTVIETETWELRGHHVPITFFKVGEHKVWGATAIMINEFLHRLRQTA